MLKRVKIAIKSIGFMALVLLGSGCSDMMSDLSDSQASGTDIYILMDLSYSCLDELNSLRNGLTLVPGEYRIGVSSFIDFPSDPSWPDDYPFRLHQALTADTEAIADAIESLDIGFGDDAPQSQLEALYQLATGEGCLPYAGPFNPSWRANSRKAVILITDAEFHNEPEHPGHDYDDTLAALRSRNISVMGVELAPIGLFQSIVSDTEGRMYSTASYGNNVGLTVSAIIDDLLNP